jgi:hypothetical protein
MFIVRKIRNTQIPSVGIKHRFRTLQQVVHTVTAGLYRLKQPAKTKYYKVTIDMQENARTSPHALIALITS